MDNLPSILTPDLGLLFWMLLAFLVVFVVLAIYGFPAIINMVEKRKQYIDESLSKAHEASERLENIRQEGEAMLQEKAREEGARLLAEARQQIESEKQNAIRDIRAQVAVLSVQIAEKVLREKLSDDSQQMQLIDKLLDEVSVNKDNN